MPPPPIKLTHGLEKDGTAERLQGRAVAWADSEVHRLALIAHEDAFGAGCEKWSAEAAALRAMEEVRKALASSFVVGYAAGKFDEEKASRTRPRK